MIPSGYKEDVVYSQIPTDGSGDLSFTRASNGTRVNSAGLVEVCPWNLFQQSEDFSNAAWTKTNTTVTSNSITAPNGTLTADLIVPANATDGVIVQASLSFIVGTSYSLSVYGKKEDFNFLLLALPSAAFPTSNRVALFDLNNGTIASSTQSGTGAVITDVGNGWYRCSITIAATATTSANVVVAARSSNNLTSLGNGTDGVYIWGAQLNTGALKPYFPTTDRLNVPRLTYQNGGGGCPSLLLEKQSTNLVLHSEQFDATASWSYSGCSVTANQTISPDGTQNADKLVENSSNTIHEIYQGLTLTSGTAYTNTIYAKSAERTQIAINFVSGGFGQGSQVIANLSTGTIGTVTNYGGVTGSTATITNVGNGWYRISLTMTPVSTTTFYADYSPAVNGNAFYQGNGTSGIYIWGSQIEASSYPTSYIPTTSSSATRVADACYKTGISSLIGSTSGAIFMDINNPNPSQYLGTPPANTIFGSINSGDYQNNFHFTTYGVNIYLYCNASGGALQAAIGTTMPTTSKIKMAVTYTNSAIKFFLNGVLVGTDTSFTLPSSMSRVDIGHMGGQPDSQRMRGSVNEFLLFTTALTDAEAIALTTL